MTYTHQLQKKLYRLRKCYIVKVKISFDYPARLSGQSNKKFFIESSEMAFLQIQNLKKCGIW